MNDMNSEYNRIEVEQWRNRMLNQLESELQTMEILRLTGVGDAAKERAFRNKIEQIKAVDIGEDEPLDKVIEQILNIIDKNIERYAVIDKIYKEETQEFEPTNEWFKRKGEDLGFKVYDRYKQHKFERVKLVKRDPIEVTALGYADFYRLVSTVLERKVKKFMNDEIKTTIVCYGIENFVERVVENGKTVGITSIFTGESPVESGHSKFEELLASFSIRTDSLRFAVSDTPFELPSVYLPQTNKNRQKFLQLYRQAGFTNGYYA